MEVLIKGCFINRIKVSCRRVYLFLVSLETSWIFRHWIFVALLWVLPETLAVNQRNNTVIKTFSNQFQRINTVIWQDEEPGSMTPYLSLCQHFFNSVLIKCNNLGEIWAINRTLCDPCKWVTEGQTGDEQGGQLTCCLRYPFSFLNIFISRFKLRINFSLGSYNISQINQKDVTDIKQNPVESRNYGMKK